MTVHSSVYGAASALHEQRRVLLSACPGGANSTLTPTHDAVMIFPVGVPALSEAVITARCV
eukprot:5218-Heterococcus_DN1.PRE.1